MRLVFQECDLGRGHWNQVLYHWHLSIPGYCVFSATCGGSQWGQWQIAHVDWVGDAHDV